MTYFTQITVLRNIWRKFPTVSLADFGLDIRDSQQENTMKFQMRYGLFGHLGQRRSFTMPTGLPTITVSVPLATFVVAGLAWSQDVGVTPDKILFGQSAAFSGPAGALGTAFRLGLQAAFREANARGGVHGRHLELLSLDDGHEPEAAIVNTQRLIEQQEVFALIGTVGTPTARSTVPVASKAGVPYVAPFSGAQILRQTGTGWENIINLRASFFQETEEIVLRLIEDLGIDRIAVLYPDDSSGRAALVAVQGVLNKRDLSLAAIGTYTRNTTAVKTAVLDLRAGDPDAVVLVGAYKPVAAAIKWARFIGFDPVFFAISLSGGTALAAELGEDGHGVYVTQVVPFPRGSDRIAARYRRALAAHVRNAEPGFVSFEGYLAGRLAIFGLEGAGITVDRRRFLDTILHAGTFYLNGFRLRFSARDNQGSDQVYLTVIGDDGQYSPITRLTLGGR